MAAVNYAESYERALAQAYPNVLNFGELYNVANNQVYKFVDSKTIHIPSISVTGRKNVNRDAIDGTFSRNVDNSFETKTLTFYREWSTSIDPADVMDTNMILTIQNATQVFNETQKFPEKDAYTISKIYSDWVAEGKTADTTVLTVDNILAVFDKMMEGMDEALVPSQGRILYVTPAVKTLLKSASMAFMTSHSPDAFIFSSASLRNAAYLSSPVLLSSSSSVITPISSVRNTKRDLPSSPVSILAVTVPFSLVLRKFP